MLARRTSSRRRRSQGGSAIVESALCFLGFIFLTVGLIEFSMAVYAYNFVTWVASDAARYASLHGFHSSSPVSVEQIRSYVRGQAVALVSSRVNINENPAFIWMPNNNPGSVVQVKVTYVVHPIVGMLMRNNLTVSSTSRMVISN
jgi:Flp pilus assembly protein TadG